MTKKKEIASELKIEDVLFNDATEILIEGINKTVKIKNPLIKQKLEARKEATTLPAWDVMTDIEKREEIAKLVALKMIVEPEITLDDYLNSNDITIMTILDGVSRYYIEKIRKLTSKKNKEVKDFLEQTMES